MATEIKCPNCGHEFPMEQSIADKVQHELEEKFLKIQRQKDDQFRKREEEFLQKLNLSQKQLAEQDQILAKKIQEAVQSQEMGLRKKLAEENDTQMRLMQERVAASEQQVKSLKEKELEVLRLQNRMEDLQRNAENEKEKYLLENRKRIQDEITTQEKEKFAEAKREWEIKMDQQIKLIEEMKRKAEQGSMQIQGEVLELMIEEMLTAAFPFDKVAEVPKGKKGADCILIVRNKFGSECGTILFESKRAATWGKEWVDKLKEDIVRVGADVAVLISQTLPDKMSERFEFRDGVWICGFNDAKLLTASLREGLIKVNALVKSQDGKEDKIQLLYDYMTSAEFSSRWKSIREVFRNMQLSIMKEKEVMEKLWKNREKQLDRAMLNSDQIIGSIEGIAGKDSIDMQLLNDTNEDDMAH